MEGPKIAKLESSKEFLLMEDPIVSSFLVAKLAKPPEVVWL